MEGCFTQAKKFIAVKYFYTSITEKSTKAL